MLNINKADVEQMVEIIEYILENDCKVSINHLLKDCNLTFDEYRLMSALSMPAIRRKNELGNMKARAAYFKGMYLKEKAEREKTDEVLRMAKDYLDRKFAIKPATVIKTAEQEAAEHGDCDNTFGND